MLARRFNTILPIASSQAEYRQDSQYEAHYGQSAFWSHKLTPSLLIDTEGK